MAQRLSLAVVLCERTKKCFHLTSCMCDAAVSHSHYSTLNSPSYTPLRACKRMLFHITLNLKIEIYRIFAHTYDDDSAACEIRDEAGENERGERKRWGKVFHLLSFLSIRLLATCSFRVLRTILVIPSHHTTATNTKLSLKFHSPSARFLSTLVPTQK